MPQLCSASSSLRHRSLNLKLLNVLLQPFAECSPPARRDGYLSNNFSHNSGHWLSIRIN